MRSPPKPTALVTGATGFIGSRLCQRLVAQGWHVRATVRATSQVQRLSDLGIELVPCDLVTSALPAPALADLEAVFHIAGLTTSANLKRLLEVNAQGTGNLVDGLLASAARPVVVSVSSIAASGPGRKPQIRTAAEPPKPVSRYGRSKLQGERELQRLARHCPVSIVRPGLVFGPGDREGYRIVQAIAKTGLHFSPGWRSPPLSVIYVDDLVEILLRIFLQGRRIDDPAKPLSDQGLYIAGRPDAYPTYRQWGQMLATAMGRGVWVVPVPPVVARVVGWIAEQMKNGAFHTDKIREALVSSWAYQDPNLIADLEFTFSDPLESQLQQTIAWYREQGWLAWK